MRLHYRKVETDRHAVCPLYAVSEFVTESKKEFPVAPHAEYIPSVVTARYMIEGKDADEALSIHLERVVDDFIRWINKIV